MDKLTQSTAANAEESAAAAEELNAQAEQMKGHVEDLVMVVEGSSQTAGSRGNGGGLTQAAAYRNMAPALPKKTAVGRHADSGMGSKMSARRLEQVIPMKDEGFKDF
jgi:methyl-accepting chemotaxis protein